ncbi:zf-HC2 domain-containing protein [Kamptonema cortianum]|nr:zf-HC2 domain-containing protein [Geitlerinema splendidum]MDK3156884.1 zf-HC2 domain-containing protein [Kamptonema cortianum]
MSEKSPKLDCAEMIERMGSYLDRELSDSEMEHVHLHLAMCGHCAGAFRWEERTLKLVKQLVRGDAPPTNLEQQIIARCREQE